jgi:hypothetical protein
MIVKPTRIQFLWGPMSSGSHHSLFRHCTRIEPKGCALISHELDLDQVYSPIRSGAPQEPKGKRPYRFSLDRITVRQWRSFESSLDQRRQQMRPNTLYQQIFTSFCFFFLRPSSFKLVPEAHAHSP